MESLMRRMRRLADTHVKINGFGISLSYARWKEVQDALLEGADEMDRLHNALLEDVKDERTGTRKTTAPTDF